MGYLLSIGISAGIIAAVFAQYAVALKLALWIFFVAMASFYAAGGKNDGFIKSIATNLAGVVWGLIIFQLLGLWSFPYAMAVIVLLAVVGMCLQANFNLLSFIPGTFLGTACLFGSNGDWQSTVTALILGAVMGWVSEQGGIRLFKLISKQSGDSNVNV